MPNSTHTPSPHRFLAPSTSGAQRGKKATALSGLRFEGSLDVGGSAKSNANANENGQVAKPKPKPVSRFANVASRTADNGGKERVVGGGVRGRKFVLGNAKRLGADLGLGTSAARLKKVESIEESEDGELSVAKSVEFAGREGVRSREEEEDHDEELLFETDALHKRRKMSPRSRVQSYSPQQDLDQPMHATPIPNPPLNFHTPKPSTHTTNPRFFIPPSNSKSASGFTSHFDSPTTPAPTTPAARPHFILPASAPSQSKPHSAATSAFATPLPETFSPSRKSQKYIPGGMASTLQSWIIETADTGFSARYGTGSASGGVIWGKSGTKEHEKEEGIKIRLRITSVNANTTTGENNDKVEAWPGGVVFVKGIRIPEGNYLHRYSRAASLVGGSRDTATNMSRTPFNDTGTDPDKGDPEMCFMLAGTGGLMTRGKAGVRIKVGDVVGVRSPLWDVDLGVSGLEGVGGKCFVGVEWVVLL